MDDRIRVKVITPEEEQEMTVMSGTTMAELIRLAYPDKRRWYPAVFHEEKVKELSDRITESSEVELIPVDSVIGFDMYKRSLIFLTIKAYHDITNMLLSLLLLSPPATTNYSTHTKVQTQTFFQIPICTLYLTHTSLVSHFSILFRCVLEFSTYFYH